MPVADDAAPDVSVHRTHAPGHVPRDIPGDRDRDRGGCPDGDVRLRGAAGRQDDGAGWRRCGFWLTQIVQLARPKPVCELAVFIDNVRRWQRSQIACPSTVTLEPAAPSGDPSLGPPGTKKGSRS